MYQIGQKVLAFLPLTHAKRMDIYSLILVSFILEMDGQVLMEYIFIMPVQHPLSMHRQLVSVYM